MAEEVTSPLEAEDPKPGQEEGEIDVAFEDIEESKKWFSWRILWAYTGPGFLMSIAYLDPGNLESDLQAGAYGGYQLLWVLLWATVLGLFLQVLAARLGVVTGGTLASLAADNYSRPVRIALWLMVELAIVASDIQEVLGSAIAIKILSNGTIPMWAGCIITGADTFTFLGLHFFGVRKLEAFFCLLITVMLVCFGADFVIGRPDGIEIAKGTAIPLVNKYGAQQAVGILGAVVMPHNLYLHSALVHSRKIDRQRRDKVAEACKYNAIESGFALLVSFIINAMVLAVFAQQFFNEDCQKSCGTSAGCKAYWPDPNGGGSCKSIGLQEAGDALRDVLGGNGGKIVWSVGLLAAGQASTMTGTYAGQFVMEGFVKMKIAPWKRVAVTRSVALIPSIVVALATTHNRTIADKLDEWLNVLQSMLLPFAILPLLKFTNDRFKMREFRNGLVVEIAAWVVSLLVMGVNFYLVYNSSTDLLPQVWWVYLLVALFAVGYIFLAYIIIHDEIVNVIRRIRGKEDLEELAPLTKEVSAMSSL